MINLPCGYVLDSDEYQYIVGKPQIIKVKNKEDGTVTEKTVVGKATYHKTIELALNSVVERIQREVVQVYQGDLETAIKRCEEAVRAFTGQLVESGTFKAVKIDGVELRKENDA